MSQPKSGTARRKKPAVAGHSNGTGASRVAVQPQSATTERLTESVKHMYDISPPAVERVLAAGLLLRVRDLLLRDLDGKLNSFGTSHARYQVLSIVCNVPEGLQLSEIAVRASVHSTTMTATIDRLVRDGLIERRPAPHDRRTILGVSTAKGRELYAKAHAELVAIEYGLSQVDSETIRNVLDGLDRIAAALERQPEE